VAKEQVLEDFRRLGRIDQIEVLECLAEIVVTSISEEEERAIMQTLDEATRGHFVSGAAAFEPVRDRDPADG
jgi:hypothetical protein